MSTKERRRTDRIKHRVVARFEIGGGFERAIILNLSETGLFLETSRFLSPGTAVPLQIGYGKQLVSLLGTVMWCRQPDAGGEVFVAGGMGIALAAAPPAYIDFVKTMRNQLTTAPRGIEERFEVYHRVRFESKGAFFSDYMQNLSHGGMYLATNQPLELGGLIRVRMEIPGLPEPIEVNGKVAYQVDAKKAAEVGRAAGVGVQFVNLDSAASAQLHHYLKRLEVHRLSRGRRQKANIPHQGSLGDFLVPEIILHLFDKDATGKLELEWRGARKTIYINHGRPVYVDSSLRAEGLGQFLVRQQKLSAGDWNELATKGLSDWEMGDELIGTGLLDPSSLAEWATALHEERLTNSFPWFDGKFYFQVGADWPEDVSFFPMQPHRLVFSGVAQWYDASLIRTWMGLDPQTKIRRQQMPSTEITVPPKILRILRACGEARSIQALSEGLKVDLEQMLPDVFALVVTGWAALDFTEVSAKTVPPKEPSPDKKPAPAPPPEAKGESSEAFRIRVEQDYEQFKGMDFYHLLNVGASPAESLLEKAFVEKSGRYPLATIERLGDSDVREKAVQLVSWIRLAYETLKDPKLRQIYARRGSLAQKSGMKIERMQAERALIQGIQYLDREDLENALKTLLDAHRKYPSDSAIKGYLGWALFRKDSKVNLQHAIEFLREAMEKDPSDPYLRFYFGEIYSFLGDWMRAEKAYAHAIRLAPHFTKALAAYDRAKRKRISLERVARDA